MPALSRLGQAIRTHIEAQLAPIAARLAPPQILTVVSFDGRNGTASISSPDKNISGTVVTFTTPINEVMEKRTVLGIPIGNKHYYVVGYL